jgi:hypothetical protein
VADVPALLFSPVLVVRLVVVSAELNASLHERRTHLSPPDSTSEPG